nr:MULTISPECIES: transposase [unclassified Mesorhizobium]
MKRSRFSEEQIIGILKKHEAGVSVGDLCRKRGSATPRSTIGRPASAGWMSPRLGDLKALEDENTRLKRLLADAMLDNAALKDLVGKKW